VLPGLHLVGVAPEVIITVYIRVFPVHGGKAQNAMFSLP
jgi:hypothetical protein